MPGPSVTVVIVTHARPTLLADALASVAAQSLRPLEVRLADDDGGTSLDRLPVLPLLELTALATRFGHAGRARNAAAAGARGDVIAFLDDDDVWRPDHLAGLVSAFADPAVAFAWRDCVVMRERLDATGRREVVESREIARDWDEALMRTNDYLPPSAWGVRRTVFAGLGGFDESFRFSEDWDFLLRLRRERGAGANAAFRRVPGTSVEVRLREQGNASADRGPERLACLRRLERTHGLEPLEVRTFWEVAGRMGGGPA